MVGKCPRLGSWEASHGKKRHPRSSRRNPLFRTTSLGRRQSRFRHMRCGDVRPTRTCGKPKQAYQTNRTSDAGERFPNTLAKFAERTTGATEEALPPTGVTKQPSAARGQSPFRSPYADLRRTEAGLPNKQDFRRGRTFPISTSEVSGANDRRDAKKERDRIWQSKWAWSLWAVRRIR